MSAAPFNPVTHQYKPEDQVAIEYQYGKWYFGKVLWVEQGVGDLKFAVVRPDDERYIFTFGSSHDMGNGYKGYICNDPLLTKVVPLEHYVWASELTSTQRMEAYKQIGQ